MNILIKKIILRAKCRFLQDEGYNVVDIAGKIGKSETFVRTWKDKSEIELRDKPKCGRGNVLTPEMKEFIDSTVGKRKNSSRKLSKKIKNKFQKKISYLTIIRYQKQQNRKARRRKRVPLLTDAQKYKRMISLNENHIFANAV